MRLRRPPAQPVGVRIIRRDGSVLAVEVVYAGRRQRIHHWQVAGAVMREGDALTVEQLPPRTAIVGAYDP